MGQILSILVRHLWKALSIIVRRLPGSVGQLLSNIVRCMWGSISQTLPNIVRCLVRCVWRSMGQALSNVVRHLCWRADDEERPSQSHHQLSQPRLSSPYKSSSESKTGCACILIPPSGVHFRVASTDARHYQSPSLLCSDSSSESTIFIPISTVDFHVDCTDTKHDQSPSASGSDLRNELNPVCAIWIPGKLQQDIQISLQSEGDDNLHLYTNTSKLSDPADVCYKTIEVVEESTPVTPSLCEQNLKVPSKKKKKNKEKISKGLTTKERWIKHYSSAQNILLVGEGDFSFSASLAVAFGSATNMIATSLNSEGFLKKNYKKAMSNIQNLRGRGCMVIHGVDATEMVNHLYLNGMIFDRVIFNFPHAGFFQAESRKSQLRRHRKLVDGFLANAKEMINEKGEIHITHKTNGFFLAWDLQRLASNRGLSLIEKVNFDVTDYPGYGTKYGFGGDKCFDCNPSKTYKFGPRDQKFSLQIGVK